MMTPYHKIIRLALCLAPLLFGLPVVQPLHAASFLTNAPMSVARRAHTATLLLDGKVLVAAGQGTNGFYLTDAELFDPATGVWSPTGSLTNRRAFHTATLLPNGKVLVAGGFNSVSLSSAELFDPASGSWTPTGSMSTNRDSHTATLLPNGKVLVVGGLDQSRSSLTSAEIYDPNSGTWTAAGTMTDSRWAHTATLLPNGKVLVAGGRQDIPIISFAAVLASAELYDPGTDIWSTQNALNAGRYDHTAILLLNGSVLVSGGFDGAQSISSAELYYPATSAWTNTAALNTARDAATATLLPDGNVFVTGGYGIGGSFLASAELYRPALGTWTNNGSMASARWQHTATLLPNAKILIAGGLNAGTFLDTTELYDTGIPITTNGSVRATLAPSAAVSAGAQWQVDGGPFHTSGSVVTNLSGGVHVISFTTVPGFSKPADQLTTIVSRTSTNNVTGVYTPDPGAVQVSLNPPGAVTDGAQWQVDGGAFQASGATVTNLSVGVHVVAFKTIGGWFAPGNQSVTIVSDTTTNLVATYSLTAGGLQVNLNPAGAVTDGAQWQVDGGAFQSSGAVVANLSGGDHLLSFKTISGWTTPSNQIVAITGGTTNVAAGSYGTLAPGAVRVNLSPAGAVSAGARWQVDGGPPQISGAVVTGLAPGIHTITFNTVAGFSTPASQTNAVSSNATNTFAGVYILTETIKPTLTVVAPRSGQRWSNSVFTATGTARDNVQVAAVFYQFNTGDWTLADTANNFASWNVPNLLLNPGTNTFKAYAVDTSNNRSATNTVKFIYVLSDRLMVLLNGKGSVSPNYSNAVLEIGKNYSMTATAATGFRFLNWTGSITTNNARLTFNMQSNLSFTANFLDITRPVNIVLTPKANQRWSNQVFTATGKASDNLRVSNVWYQLNTNSWMIATTANNWTNWTATNLVLTPGTNFIRAYAEDTTGNRSLTNTIKFIYVLTDRLIVQFNGKGTLSPNYSNALLEIGKNYSMTATAATGFRFLNWTGSITTNNARLTFNMQSNLSFTANFLDIARPVNIVTNPVAKQKLSNVVFTASGKATDNVGVISVWYQLNGTGWNAAVLALNHTNWSTPGLTNFLLSGSNQLQAFAADAVGNVSFTNTVNFTYLVQPVADWAPDTLNGLLATVTQSDSGRTNTQSVGFDLVTFAQTGTDTNADNYGVGDYLYTKTGTNTALLTLALTAPPTQTNDHTDVSLVFTNHYGGYFTNDSGGESGGVSLVIATNFLPGFVTGKTLVATNTGSGTSTAVKFVSRVTFNQTGTGGSGSGSYTLARFSPVSGMLTLTYTNAARLGQISYVQTTFTNAANGVFFVNSFDALGNLQDSNSGKFKLQ